jgi:hypothetical protein
VKRKIKGFFIGGKIEDKKVNTRIIIPRFTIKRRENKKSSLNFNNEQHPNRKL